MEGLESGVNDYMTKPFEPKELLLRINNLLGNQLQTSDSRIVKFGNLTYNLESKNLTKNNENILLSSSEMQLLDIFTSNMGKTFSREELCEIIGGLSLRSIDVQITRLRGKIETNPKEAILLKTIRNIGYALYAN